MCRPSSPRGRAQAQGQLRVQRGEACPRASACWPGSIRIAPDELAPAQGQVAATLAGPAHPAGTPDHPGPRSLFILPTRLGLCYLLVMLAIYLLGTNYQNNLVLLVAYALGSLFMVTMWLTHRNLLGLAPAGASRAG